MKLLSYLFTLFFAFNALAVAPYGIKGQQQAATLYSNVHQFPNNQVTTLGGINALVETGNKNILSNPSFEHSTFSTGWTSSGTGSFFEDVGTIIDGKKSAGFLLVSQTINLIQDSTTYAGQFADGVQGVVTVRVKANNGATGIKVCSRQAGVTSTTNCVEVVANGKWGLYKVPTILGGTSNGISIASSGSVTSVVYIDDAFVGATDIAQISSAIGPWTTFTPTVSHDSGTMTNSTVTAKWRQVGEQIEVSGLIRFSALSAAFSGMYVTIPSSYTIDATKFPISTGALDISLGEGSIYDIGANLFPIKAYYSTPTGVNLRGYFTSVGLNPGPVSSAGNLTNTSPIPFNSTDTINFNFTAPIVQFSGSVSTYSTPMLTNADRIGEVIQTTNSTAPQGFISALNKSIGQTGSGATYTGQTYFALYEHLWSIAGLTTTAGDVYRISSAKGASASADFAANKTITIDYETNAPFIRGKASAASIGAYQGSAAPNISGNIGRIPDATGDGAFLVGAATGFQKGSSGAAQSTVNFDASRSSSVYQAVTEVRPKNVSLNFFIRFAGDTQLITGQFNGLQTCADTLACTDTFSASVSSTGVVSSENLDWISGNCSITSTSIYSCTFKTGIFTVPPVCTFGAGTSEPLVQHSALPSSTGLSALTRSAGGTFTAGNFQVSCQKTGADYIGKTAMAVASDQNVRSIGSTNVDIQSVYFAQGAVCTTGNCTINNLIGNKITSVSWSSVGAYSINGIDGTKYNCTGSAYDSISTGNTIGFMHDRTLSTSSLVRISASVAAVGKNVGWASVTCIGIP